MKIWFDMDGTIADFYGVDGWLEALQNEQIRPYLEAKPLFNFSAFARMIHRLQAAGYKVGIVTWGSKFATAAFNTAVEQAKCEWLRKHLPSVSWDAFCFMPYGTNKNAVNAGQDILFDDEAHNRENWGGAAYEPTDIQKVLTSLLKCAIIDTLKGGHKND